MTKKTEAFILSVYEYCLKNVLRANNEGILVLEANLYKQSITESGKYLFNRKVDKYLYWIMRFLVDDGYTIKTNQNLLKSFSKMSSRRTRLALNVVSLCFEGLMNKHTYDLIFVEVCSYLGVNMYQKLWDISITLNREYSTGIKNIVFTEEQKNRIEEVNVFFKLKEAECKQLLLQKYKKLSEYQKKIPEFDKAVTIKLIYHAGKFEIDIYNIPDPFNEDVCPHYIGNVLVCSSLYEFWKHYLICDYSTVKLLALTDDIPNEVAKSLEIKTEMELTLTE